MGMPLQKSSKFLVFRVIKFGSEPQQWLKVAYRLFGGFKFVSRRRGENGSVSEINLLGYHLESPRRLDLSHLWEW